MVENPERREEVRQGKPVFLSQGNLTLEAALSQAYGLGHAVLFGIARSGIRALLEVLAMAGKPALIPSNMCSAPLAAVVAAEARPVAVAVSALNGHVSATRFQEVMRAEPVPGIVMPTHLYGHHEDYAELHPARSASVLPDGGAVVLVARP